MHSETDWQRLETMTDKEIDYSDIHPLDEGFFQRAERRVPDGSKVIVTIQVDPDVFEWFDAQEGGWEQRMRAALRIYVEAHQEQHPFHSSQG